MAKEKYLIIINEEIKLYSEIYSINLILYENLKKFDLDTFKNELNKKDKIINKVQDFDKDLSELWQSWEQYKNIFSEKDKEKIKELKTIMEKNFEIENLIINEFEILVNKEKQKNFHIQKGKRAFNAYKTKKVTFPYFVNEKG